MGMRAVYGFLKNGKYKVTETNFDGAYEDLGNKIVDFINTTTIKEMNKIFEKIILVDVIAVATKEQIKECKRYTNLEIGTRKLTDFNCLLCKSRGDLRPYRDENLKYMEDHQTEIGNYFYEYIINLDDNTLEIRQYGDIILRFDLLDIPKSWIKQCDNVDMNSK